MILIVEDDNVVAAGMERVLRFAGHDAVAVHSSTEALALLPVRKPGLIILDIQLPVIDGLTLLRAIRSDPAFARVPIMMYTSDYSKKSEEIARECGAQDFVVKGTVGWESFMARVEQLLKGAQSTRAG